MTYITFGDKGAELHTRDTLRKIHFHFEVTKKENVIVRIVTHCP